MQQMKTIRFYNFDPPSPPNSDDDEDNHERQKSPLSIPQTNNIMFDQRVYRGNTYSMPVMTEVQKRNRQQYEDKYRCDHQRRKQREEFEVRMSKFISKMIG